MIRKGENCVHGSKVLVRRRLQGSDGMETITWRRRSFEVVFVWTDQSVYRQRHNLHH